MLAIMRALRISVRASLETVAVAQANIACIAAIKITLTTCFAAAPNV